MYINLNNKSTVKLTKTGKKIYYDYIHKIIDSLPKNGNTRQVLNENLIDKINSEEVTFTLWELMNIFGDDLIPGAESPFEDMIIEIHEN